MKLLSILVFIILVTACSDKNEPELVQRTTEISAFDVGNEGNSSDIRVNFGMEQIAGIGEFRILVIPSALSDEFEKGSALNLSSDSYTNVKITTTDLSYSVRLSVKTDVEGNPVTNNKEYVIKILMIGDKFNQLSLIESNKITLTDQGIFNGYYEGFIEGRSFIQGNCDNSISTAITAEFSALANNSYNGYIKIKAFEFLCDAHLPDSDVSFTLEGDSILNLSLSKSIITHSIYQTPFAVISDGIFRGDLNLDVTHFNPGFPERGISLNRTIKPD